MTGRWLVAGRFIYGVLLLCALLHLAWVKPSHALEATVVRLEPANLAMVAGETTTLAVRVEGATTVYGVEVHLLFDQTKVRVLDADVDKPGIQVRSGDFLNTSQGFLVMAEADNGVGEVVFALTLLAPATPVSGDGTLVVLDLLAVETGSSELSLDSVILATQEGVALPLSVEHGQLTVAASQPDTSLPKHSVTTSPSRVAPESGMSTGIPSMNAPSTPITKAVSLVAASETMGQDTPTDATISESVIGNEGSLLEPGRIVGSQTPSAARTSQLPIIIPAMIAIMVTISLFFWHRLSLRKN
jgi:hypothetical protein